MRKLSFIVSACALAGLAASAQASFIVDPNPGGDMFFNNIANKNVSTFTGTVDSDTVTVTTLGNVDTGSGFSNITPVKNGTLTSLTFTPADPKAFSGFSFRGQLLAAGTVTLTVQDDQGDAPQVFHFNSLPKNSDFARLGIIAVSGSGETIKSVTLTNAGFKEEKQNEFTLTPTVTPEPASLGLLGVGAVSVLARRRRA